jgi:hypothetical protein
MSLKLTIVLLLAIVAWGAVTIVALHYDQYVAAYASPQVQQNNFTLRPRTFDVTATLRNRVLPFLEPQGGPL